MYTIDSFKPSNFAGITSTKLLEEKYFEFLDAEHFMVDAMLNELQGTGRQYISDLVHEGRSTANTAISSIKNLDWYRENRPKEAKEIERTMNHYLLLFCIYMQSLALFYSLWSFGEEKI